MGEMADLDAERAYEQWGTDKKYGAHALDVALLDQGLFWYDKSKKLWRIRDLRDDHLQAIMDWLKQWWSSVIEERYIQYKMTQGPWLSRKWPLSNTMLWRTLEGEQRHRNANKPKPPSLREMTTTEARLLRNQMLTCLTECCRRQTPRSMRDHLLREIGRMGFVIVKRDQPE